MRHDLFWFALTLLLLATSPAMAAYPEANYPLQPSQGIRPTTVVIVNADTTPAAVKVGPNDTVPVSGQLSATLAQSDSQTNGNVNVVNPLTLADTVGVNANIVNMPPVSISQSDSQTNGNMNVVNPVTIGNTVPISASFALPVTVGESIGASVEVINEVTVKVPDTVPTTAWIINEVAVNLAEDTIGVTAQITNEVRVAGSVAITNDTLGATAYITGGGLEASVVELPDDTIGVNAQILNKPDVNIPDTIGANVAITEMPEVTIKGAVTATDTFGALAFDTSVVLVTLDQQYSRVIVTADTDVAVKIGAIPADVYDGTLLLRGERLVLDHYLTSIGARTLSDAAEATAALRVQGMR